MNTIFHKGNNLLPARLFGLFAVVLLLVGCEKDLPEAGSIPDQTPPQAAFTYAQYSPDDYLEVTFSNISTSATTYLWDFGDETTSTEKEPVHFYPAEGTYTVTLTASDNNGLVSVHEETFDLTEPDAFIPPILEAGFEDGDLPDGAGDGRDSWRNSDLGGVIQITSSPVNSGSQAAKLPGNGEGQRIGYQQITVTENTVYDVSFYYTMLSEPEGYLTVSILAGPVSSHAEALAATIGSITVHDQLNPEVFVQETVSFDSGNNTEVAIYFFNDGTAESRLDDFSINLGEAGTIPPVASYTYEEDVDDFYTLHFSNNSLNADSYLWDFGDGSNSTEENPSHQYSAEGIYNITLTASNSLNGESDMYSVEVEIAEPSAIFVTNPSFDDEEVQNDNRIAWRNSALEASADDVIGDSDYVLQMSTSSRTGANAGKLPTAENSANPRRWMYQAIVVEPNTDYTITGWIRNKNANVGSTVTFSIYDAPFDDAANIGNASSIIASSDFDASTGHDTDVYTEATITFNSGSSSEIVLFVTNDYTLETVDSESFCDDSMIE